MNAHEQTTVVPPTAAELPCINLLTKQGNIVDQLAKPSRPREQRAMIDGAIEIVSSFLDFSDKFYDDSDSFALATEVIEIVEKASNLKHELSQIDAWFRGSKKSELEVRHEYELLGATIASFCEHQYAICLKLFQPGSTTQNHFFESSTAILRELRDRW